MLYKIQFIGKKANESIFLFHILWVRLKTTVVKENREIHNK